jgi:NADH:ubiquinone oxidoreductase subunit F (NADH-binding)/ferredoxin
MTVSVVVLGTPRLTMGFDRFQRLDLERHRAMHGRLNQLSLGDLIQLVEGVDLRGRGGAGFPFGTKLAAVSRSAEAGRPTVVMVNGAEGEPGSAKDALLLTRAPHLVLDGAVLVARALRAEEIVIGVVEDTPADRSIRAALAERKLPVPARIAPLVERFISGEGGALVRAANGDVPIPPGRKVRASNSGVDGKPTLLSNTETFAQLAVLASLGSDLYSSVGAPQEPGTVLLTVAGGTVVEAPAGTPLSAVLEACGADPGQGLLIGGYHGAWLRPEAVALTALSRAGLEAVGGSLGAGIILPLGQGTCPLAEVIRISAYLAAESSGQCGPCRMGLPDIVRSLTALADGSGGVAAVRRAVGIGRGRGACSHPDGTARFVLSALEVFSGDIATHRDHGTCGLSKTPVFPMPPVDATARLTIDWSRCEGHGVCAFVAPEIVHLDRHGYPVVLNTPMPTWVERGAQRAVAMCPALALRLVTQQPTPPPAVIPESQDNKRFWSKNRESR